MRAIGYRQSLPIDAPEATLFWPVDEVFFGMYRLVDFSLVCLGFIGLILLLVLVMGGFELLSGVGVHGWIVFTLGIVITSALGVALMALVFHSDRSGQDERAGGRRTELGPLNPQQLGLRTQRTAEVTAA
jgi:ABC-type transporter Mla maintaining outer membrane lipid asymmetry permease subunit MlaE